MYTNRSGALVKNGLRILAAYKRAKSLALHFFSTVQHFPRYKREGEHVSFQKLFTIGQLHHTNKCSKSAI